MNAGVFVLRGFRRRDEHRWTMGSVEDPFLVDCSSRLAAFPSGPVSESLSGGSEGARESWSTPQGVVSARCVPSRRGLRLVASLAFAAQAPRGAGRTWLAERSLRDCCRQCRLLPRSRLRCGHDWR